MMKKKSGGGLKLTHQTLKTQTVMSTILLSPPGNPLQADHPSVELCCLKRGTRL